MKRIFVAGGCGFLGSHVCEHFKKLGWDVVAYDNMSKFETSRIQFGDVSKIRNYNFNYLADLGVRIIIGDIRNMDTLNVLTRGIDFVVNCAAQPTMTLSEEDPRLDLETNAIGTFNLLECARKYAIPLITCSTIHVYGTGINSGLKETKDSYVGPIINESYPILTGHLTPLHASKAASEAYVQVYSDTYGVKAAAFRLTGFYGPRQFGSEDHGWVSLLAIKTVLGLPIQLIGTGKQVRDILYVEDVVKAVEMWYTYTKPGIYNICGGPRTAISVLQMLDLLTHMFKVSQVFGTPTTRAGDLLFFVGSYTKAREAFGWEPKILPAEGIERFAEWLQKNKNVFRS